MELIMWWKSSVVTVTAIRTCTFICTRILCVFNSCNFTLHGWSMQLRTLFWVSLRKVDLTALYQPCIAHACIHNSCMPMPPCKIENYFIGFMGTIKPDKKFLKLATNPTCAWSGGTGWGHGLLTCGTKQIKTDGKLEMATLSLTEI